MTVRMHVDTSAADREFDRLADMGAATTRLEQILAAQFAGMQAATHVITGSLRGSEDIDSDFRAGRWVGQIVAGGASPGFPNDPVVYAVYEAARGGAHDFRVPVEARSHGYGQAMRAHLRGR